MYYLLINTRLKNVVLHASDTDSYMVSAEGKSEEDMIRQLGDIMDYSGEDENHPMFSNEKKKIPGYLKSEFDFSRRLYEGVFLRSKLYSLRVILLAQSFITFSPRARPSLLCSLFFF